MENESVDELIGSLASDKLITLNIRNNSEPSFTVQIQQTVLEAASTWFRNALKDDKKGQTNVIILGEDDPETWKIVLYWIVHHKLPENKDKTRENFIRNAKYWILGHKYGIAGFQDEVMMQLLKGLEVPCRYFDHVPEMCQDLIPLTPPGSMLMRLLAELVVEYEEGADGSYRITDVDPVLKRNAGFWIAYEKALQDFERDDGGNFGPRRIGLEDCSQYHCRAHWRDYMVGELPAFVHCIRDEA